MKKTGLFNVLVDDWKKIPQNLRYWLIAGAFLIFNTWLLDTWPNDIVYRFWGIDIRYMGYNIGLTLILLALSFLVTRQFFYFQRILHFRRKYPISKLDKDFHLLWFKGKLILFDNKAKMYFHVYPWETAQDLLFVSHGHHMKGDFFPRKKAKYGLYDYHVLDTSKYKNGGSICTQ